ncbi:hypothetical protein KAI87_16230, partial [Myxococcota bacterium]|nr:hypothetical protein [Myxococcota bacterium]
MSDGANSQLNAKIILEALRQSGEERPSGVRELWATVDLKLLTEGEAKRWYLILSESGLTNEADALVAELGFDYTFVEILGDATEELELVSDEGSHDDPWLDLTFTNPDEDTRDHESVELFLRFFGGRRDLYAKQWYDPKRKRSGYHPVREPLTASVAERHLEGSTTIGQYLLFPDDTVNLGVIDLDLDSNALAEFRATSGEGASAAAHPMMRTYGLSLLESARSLGITLWPEDSGGKGLHLWLFLN